MFNLYNFPRIKYYIMISTEILPKNDKEESIISINQDHNQEEGPDKEEFKQKSSKGKNRQKSSRYRRMWTDEVY